jgi:hypothetical protein
MRQWWLAIAPGPRFTRAMLMSEAGKCVLRARLPYGPGHPLAVQRLREALSLWRGGLVHVVLAVEEKDVFCATPPPWQAALEVLTPPCLYKIVFAESLRSDSDMRRQLKAWLADA